MMYNVARRTRLPFADDSEFEIISRRFQPRAFVHTKAQTVDATVQVKPQLFRKRVACRIATQLFPTHGAA